MLRNLIFWCFIVTWKTFNKISGILYVWLHKFCNRGLACSSISEISFAAREILEASSQFYCFEIKKRRPTSMIKFLASMIFNHFITDYCFHSEKFVCSLIVNENMKYSIIQILIGNLVSSTSALQFYLKIQIKICFKVKIAFPGIAAIS